MVLKVYFDVMSQPSRAVLIFLRANANVIPFEEIPVALRKGEHLSKDYEKINPFKKVPAIDHDGFKLAESISILRYLCRTFPVAENWYPKDSQKQARVDEYMAWQHLNLRAFGSMYFRTKIINPVMGLPVKEKTLQTYGEQLHDALGVIENIYLQENPFIAGKDLTIADLLATAELEQPGMAGYDVYKGHPKITNYMNTVKAKLQPHYNDVNSIVYKLQKAKL